MTPLRDSLGHRWDDMDTHSTISEDAQQVGSLAGLRALLTRIVDEAGKNPRVIEAENVKSGGLPGLSKSTIDRKLKGNGKLDPQFIERIAASCGVDEDDIHALVTAWKRVRGIVPEQRPGTGPTDRDRDHLDTVDVMMAVADMLSAEPAGLPAARSLYERARIARALLLGDDDPLTLDAAHNLGTVLAQVEQLQTAVTVLAETYKKRVHQLGPEHPATLSTLENLAAARAGNGEIDAAVNLLEKALDACRPPQSPGHARYAKTAQKLLTALTQVGNDLRRRQIEEELARVTHHQPS